MITKNKENRVITKITAKHVNIYDRPELVWTAETIYK